MARKPEPANAFRALSSFAIPGKDGLPRVIRQGDVIGEDDPIVRTHKAVLQPMSEYVEQATAAPGEFRPVRIPSGVTAEEATKARDTRVGPRNAQGDEMPHTLPPEHEDSPASTFAPFQPAAGVVADDADEKGQNLAGGPKASDAQEEYAGYELDTSPGHTGEAGAPAEAEEEPKPRSRKK